MKRFIIALFALSIAASGASAEVIKGSREYTRIKKEVQLEKKQLLLDRQEVAEFSSLLREMEAADPTETARYYWNMNNQVRAAMEREYTQIQGQNARTAVQQKASVPVPGVESLQDLTDSDVRTISTQRAQRMKLIVIESKGLERAMSEGDRDSHGRYHHLLAEFLGIMRAEAEDAADAISQKEESLR